jgi:hypothetical protein
MSMRVAMSWYCSFNHILLTIIVPLNLGLRLDLWCLTPLSVLSWRSVLLMEETGIPGETLSSTPRHERSSSSQL